MKEYERGSKPLCPLKPHLNKAKTHDVSIVIRASLQSAQLKHAIVTKFQQHEATTRLEESTIGLGSGRLSRLLRCPHRFCTYPNVVHFLYQTHLLCSIVHCIQPRALYGMKQFSPRASILSFRRMRVLRENQLIVITSAIQYATNTIEGLKSPRVAVVDFPNHVRSRGEHLRS